MNTPIKSTYQDWADYMPPRPMWLQFIFTATTQMAAMMALFMLYQADQWITVGYGLHPFISIPVAIFLLTAPHWFDN